MTKSSHCCQTKTTLSHILVIALFCTQNKKKSICKAGDWSASKKTYYIQKSKWTIKIVLPDTSDKNTKLTNLDLFFFHS